MLLSKRVSDSGGTSDDDSMMELERPGEEKKKRCEDKAVAKSGMAVPSSDSEKEISSLEWPRDLESSVMS